MSLLRQTLVVAAYLLGAAAQYFDGYQTVTDATTPVQIRLAYQGPTAMEVSWNTFSQLSNPSVQYGLTPDALTQSASSSESVTYPTSLTYNNHVNITGLLPYTTYYYLPQNSNATTPYSFTTARLAGDLTPFTMAVVVDMGTFGVLGLSDHVGSGAANPLRVNEQTTVTAITQKLNDYEFMVHAGDIAYADYWLKEEIGGYLPNNTAQGPLLYEQILNAFYDEVAPVTVAKPYMVNPGNHEANCDNGGTTNKTSGQVYTDSICPIGQNNFTGYINHWRMPSAVSGGLGNMWFSYDYGMVHFVHIDTETDLGNGLVGPDEGDPEHAGPFGTPNQQINWLKNDLASVNKTVTPWIVVFGHRGWYLSSSKNACVNCQTAFEQLFWQYDVDLYINGHAHFFERTAPIYKGVVDPNGLNNPNATLYITNGAAGHYDGLDTFTTIQPYSVARTAADYAWSTISFTNSTHLTVDTLWSANNSVFDSATLYKKHVYTAANVSSSSSTTTSSASSSSATSMSSDNATATANIATTTTSGGSIPAFPSYTNFNGAGHLYVYSGGLLQGDIGSAGTWYNAVGQNIATYTAVPLYSNGTAFYLTRSGPVYCAIGTDFSFGCSGTTTSGATVFGQTADGNLTYNGSPAFYASSSASGSSRPTVYATSLPVSLNINWAVGSATYGVTSTGVSISASATATSSSTVKTTSATNATAAASTSSAIVTSSSSVASLTSTSSSAAVATSSSSSSTTSSVMSTTTANSTTALAASGSVITITITTTQAAAPVTTTATVLQPSPTTQTIVSTQQTTVTQSVTATSTEIDSTTLTQPTTVVSLVTQSTTLITTASTTLIQSTTITESTISTTTDVTTLTLPASTLTESTTATITESTTSTIPASTIISTSTVTQTLPASTETSSITTTQSASTVYITLPASTTTSILTQAVSTIYITEPASITTTTLTQSASTIYITQAASTTISTITSYQPAITVTSISTSFSTTTATATADPTTITITSAKKTATTTLTSYSTVTATVSVISTSVVTSATTATRTTTSTATLPRSTISYTTTATTTATTTLPRSTVTVTTTKKGNGNNSD